jgi:hypothetical protein
MARRRAPAERKLGTREHVLADLSVNYVEKQALLCGAATTHPWSYPPGGTHVGHGRFWQGSKMGHNISRPPLPNIGDKGTRGAWC